MKKWIYSIVTICSIMYFLAQGITQAHATEFSSKYNVTYTITKEKKVEVKKDIQITNTSAEYYVSKFTLDLGTDLALDAQAVENNKTLRTSVIQKTDTAELSVEFHDKTIGKGKTKRFTVTYTSLNTLQKSGNLYSLTIPKIIGDGITDYAITVIIPQSLGTLSSMMPIPHEKTTEKENTILKYTKQQITQSAITMYIGNEQYYTLGLTYYLKNPLKRPAYTEIALPPDTPYQKIIYDNLEPKPENITIDEDGNYIARYTLLPGEEINVQFTGKAIIYKDPQYQESQLTEGQKLMYLQKQPYWETDDAKIASLANKLKKPEKIYNYVVEYLTYDESKLKTDQFKRLGAKNTLENPTQSVCMEFTDLFVTLARAAGIPAREVNGYAHTTDPITRPATLSQDILHAWAEYYDEEKGWIQVDPTWQKTTQGIDYFSDFDLNHIAFVRKGMSSEYPYPAGAYKSEHTKSRDVLVSLTEVKPKIKETFEILPQEKKTYLAGNKIEISVEIKNTGNVTIFYPAEKTILENGKTKKTNEIVRVPPFAKTKIMLASYTSAVNENKEITGTININNKTEEVRATIVPWYKSWWFYIAMIYGIGIPVLAYYLYQNIHQNTLKKRNVS